VLPALYHPWQLTLVLAGAQTAVLAVTLLPLRLLLFLFVLMTYSVIGLLCTINVPLDQPLSPFRRRMLCCSGMMCARLGLFILGFYYIPIRGRRDVGAGQYKMGIMCVCMWVSLEVLCCSPASVPHDRFQPRVVP